MLWNSVEKVCYTCCGSLSLRHQILIFWYFKCMCDSIGISAILLKNSNNNNKPEMFLLSLEIALRYKLLFQMLVVYELFGQNFLWPIIVVFSHFCILRLFKLFLTFPISLAWEVFLQHWYRWLCTARQRCF